MTVAPLASTIVAVALIPVAFLFCHAFLTGRGKKRLHPVSGAAAIVWDLTVSIGYMLYRSLGGAIDDASLHLTATLNVYFAIHIATAIIVMTMEIVVLALGFLLLKRKIANKWHGKLATILFVIWWFAFLSGEKFNMAKYVL